MRLGRFIAVGIVGLGIGGFESAMAQSIGIKAGLSFGKITNEGLLPSNLDTRTGGAGGISFRTGSGILGLGVEALYAQRGATSDQSFATAQTRLDYVDVPVYLRIAIPTPSVHPFAYAGPQVSFEVHCRTANGADCLAQGSRKKTDYAGVIGAGLRFGGKSGAGGVSLEGRYVYGLRDLDLSTVTSSESYKNRTFMILLGLEL
jgi:hypothetical protein